MSDGDGTDDGDDRERDEDREVVGGSTGDGTGEAVPTDGEGPDIGATRGENTITGAAENDPDAPAGGGDGDGAEVVDTSVTVDADDRGKTVRSDDGEELGLVVEVADDGDALFVDPHPRVAEHVAADHGWTERESGDFRVEAASVKAIDGDAVWVEAAGTRTE